MVQQSKSKIKSNSIAPTDFRPVTSFLSKVRNYFRSKPRKIDPSKYTEEVRAAKLNKALHKAQAQIQLHRYMR
ncbi:MAG: hypothetical protein ACXAB7_08575 [Candidatus Kariarchaeaceae archaeon]